MRLPSSMSSTLPVSFHQPGDDVRAHLAPLVDQVLDRVGDLELAALARLDRARPRRRSCGRTGRRRPAPGRCAAAWASLPRRTTRSPRARRRRTPTASSRARAGSARSASRWWNSHTNGVMPSLIRLSPRYMTNGSPSMQRSEILTACASPSGASCSMYVTSSPKLEPSPTAARISAWLLTITVICWPVR